MTTKLALILVSLSLTMATAVHAGEGELSKSERRQYNAMLKAIDGNDGAAVEKLIKDKIKLDLQEDSRAAPTFMTQAALKGNNDIILALLKAGASIESTNGDGHTPLFCAVMSDKLETVQLLISKKADVNATAPNGDTPLSWAKGVARPNKKMIDVLVKAGAK
ncbi:ankyrin repeat domain-containing protein [Undibacterium sp. TJN19]|uniref:ankyrin repeat domain-containing protein n=1 Tax=Undibacterium sp. TJN19 TaxID=3413055 RepID=UPI003BF2B8F8